MKKLLLSLFVICTVFAGAWNDAYWNYHNPYIYHYLNVEVWSTETMHQSLNSLGLEQINISAITDEPTKTNLQNAISSLNKAKTSKQACEALYASTIASLPSEIIMTGIINPIYLSLKIQLLMATGMITVNSECSSYGEHWIATMNSAESALVLSKKELNKRTESAVEKFSYAKNAGICDDDFTGEAKDLCKNAEFDYGALNGKYLPDLNNYCDYFTAESEKYAPNMTGYSSQISNIFNIAIPAADEVETDSREAIAKADEEYGFLNINTEQKMKEAKQKLNIMNDQKLILITDSVYSEESKGTIAYRYENIKENVADADSEYVTAVFSSTSTTKGHMKKSVVLMKKAYFSYDYAVNETEIILDDAKKVVDAQKEEALNELGAFEQKGKSGTVSATAKELYSSAQGNFAKGEDALRLGEQFEYYLLAASNARKALTMLEEKPAELETEVKAEFKKTQGMIVNAKKDGISVYSEEEELKLLSGVIETWVVPDLIDIQNGIMKQAQIKYGYLETERKEILKKISLSGGKLDDLLVEMKKTEGTAFDGTRLDVAAGIGTLADIAKEYAYINGEIDKDIKTIVENGLNKDLTTDIENTELDAVANISAYLFIANPYGFGAKGIFIKQKTPLELAENDITEGAEFVDSAIYQSGTLNIQISEVKPYEQLLISFNKQAIVAPVTKKEKTITGNPDGNADVNEKISFEAMYDGTSIYVPSQFKDWTVDGKTVAGLKTGKLSNGKHVLEGAYKINDAFVMKKLDFKAIKTGLNSEVSYDIVIVPEIDLDIANIVINEETGDRITGFSVLSYGGAEVKSKKSLGNNMYSVQLNELKAWENATLRVAYTIEGSKEYAEAEIALLKKGEWDSATNALIGSAETALSENDTRRAVEYVEKAKAQIERGKLDEANEMTKLNEEKELVEIQKDEVDSALEIADENNYTNTQTYYQLETRENELNNALKAATSAELSGFDSSWAKKKAIEIRKDTFERYNSLKQKYLKINNGVANETVFAEFENAFSKLEATGSLDDAVLVEVRLKPVEELVNKKTKISDAEKQSLLADAKLLTAETNSLLGAYTKEYDSAKGSQVSALFGPDYKTVQKELTALDNLVKKSADAEQIADKISSVKKLKNGMSETLDYLKQESNRKCRA